MEKNVRELLHKFILLIRAGLRQTLVAPLSNGPPLQKQFIKLFKNAGGPATSFNGSSRVFNHDKKPLTTGIENHCCNILATAASPPFITSFGDKSFISE